VADHQVSRDGRFVERIGFFNPIARGGEENSRVDLERFDYWVSQGAQVSDRVKQITKKYRKATSQQGDEVEKGAEAEKEAAA
jgi:small subunit ribosomal protein S16